MGLELMLDGVGNIQNRQLCKVRSSNAQNVYLVLKLVLGSARSKNHLARIWLEKRGKPTSVQVDEPEEPLLGRLLNELDYVCLSAIRNE